VRRLLLAAAMALVVVATLAQPRATSAGEPVVHPDFEDESLTPVFRGTALAFTPDGRLLITSRNGHLRVYDGGVLQDPPGLDIESHTCSDNERGLLGVAVDPEFEQNHFIYVYYTHTYTGSCPLGSTENPVNRVSRFVLNEDNTVDEGAETILLDNMHSYYGVHNAGDLEFGPDDYLYVSTGDNGCDYAGDSGCQNGNNATRDENVLIGKILRITRDGNVPPDNPFMGEDSDRCALTGKTEPGRRCQETYAWGFRNPFRISFDPNQPRFFINDVGGNHWEEVDLGIAGADYGWNVREGFCATGTANCGNTPPGMTDPLYAYDHSDGCRAITGGAFVPHGIWPAQFEGNYLYADYNCRRIYALSDPGGANEVTKLVSLPGDVGPVDMVFGPSGEGQALYYISHGDSALHRLTYIGDPPVTLFEGWNLVTWTGDAVAGEAIQAAADSAIEPDVWVSLAAYDGTWRQWFADPPLPDFNTLQQIASGQDIWIFVTEEASFSP
jgi:glucose/arabinose dehydrogenase